MTTVAEARAELVAALVDADLDAHADPGEFDPPWCYVRADGIPEPGHIVRGAVLSQWSVVVVAGGWDHEGTAAMLDNLKQTALEAVRALDGWQVGSVSRDGIRRHGGADLLTADVIASRYVNA